jgi:hypothetical protein
MKESKDDSEKTIEDININSDKDVALVIDNVRQNNINSNKILKSPSKPEN